MAEARKACLHQAFRASFTLAASLYIRPADPALGGDLPLGMRSLAAQPIAQGDDLSLPGRQAGLDALPHFFTGVPGVQFFQHIVIHRDYVHQGERVPVASRLQRLGERDLSLQLLLGPKMHQDLICYPHLTAHHFHQVFPLIFHLLWLSCSSHRRLLGVLGTHNRRHY